MKKRILSLLLALIMLLSLTGCAEVVSQLPVEDIAEAALEAVLSDDEESGGVAAVTVISGSDEEAEEAPEAEEVPETEEEPQQMPDEAPAETEADIDQEGYYYDLENVVLYLDTYGCLPGNYITKNEARDLGWSGGSVENYLEGAAIGGDSFGNREGLLPKADGRKYTECDLDTLGQSSRGAHRLLFSNDGLYFYTQDHYESFTQVFVENGEVRLDD